MTPEDAQRLLDRLDAAKADVLSHHDWTVHAVIGMLAGLHRAIEIVKEIAEGE